MLFIISSLRARALSYCYKERERDGRWGPNVVFYWSLEGAYIGVMALSPFNRHGTDWLRVSRSLNVSKRRKTRCGRLQYIYIYFPTLSLFLSFFLGRRLRIRVQRVHLEPAGQECNILLQLSSSSFIRQRRRRLLFDGKKHLHTLCCK